MLDLALQHMERAPACDYLVSSSRAHIAPMMRPVQSRLEMTSLHGKASFNELGKTCLTHMLTYNLRSLRINQLGTQVAMDCTSLCTNILGLQRKPPLQQSSTTTCGLSHTSRQSSYHMLLANPCFSKQFIVKMTAHHETHIPPAAPGKVDGNSMMLHPTDANMDKPSCSSFSQAHRAIGMMM